MRTARLELAGWQEVCALLAHPERRAQEFARRLHADGQGQQQERTALERQVGTLRQGWARRIASDAEGLIETQAFEPRVTRLHQRITHVEAQCQQLAEAETRQRELRLIIGRVEEFAAQVQQNLATLEWHRQREILRALVRRVEIGVAQVQVVFRVDAFAGEADPEKKACNFVRGVLSPLLLKVALHGMEQALGTSYTPRGVTRGTSAVVRYADDLAVFCPTQEKAIAARSLLAPWLKARGLQLSDEKTQIRHLQEGCNFLGFTIRHYPAPNSSRSGYKLLITPSTDSINQLQRQLTGLWRKHVGTPTVALINEMNPVIRGWSTYFRTGVAKETFSALDNFMYYRAQRYMKRRHPRKSGRWRTQKYRGRSVGRQDQWVFQDKGRHATLRKCAWTKIVRHRLVRSTYSPDDPTLQDYWRQRRAKPHVTTRRGR